jgi:hypothetical protein
MARMQVNQADISEMCFLCKRKVKLTEEHVFPKWLQRRYSLWRQFVVLKNGSKFRYDNLKVLCCEECNSTYLSQIENRVAQLVSEEDVLGLRENSNDTFIWLYKIMYGLNYKEMFLRNDIKDPFSEPIVSIDAVFERDTYNLFPLFARGLVVFDGFLPYSLFVFKLSDSSHSVFYYADEPYKLFASIIMGNIGIICSFQDDGYIKSDIERIIKISERSTLTLPEFGDFASFVLHLKTRMKMLPNTTMAH